MLSEIVEYVEDVGNAGLKARKRRIEKFLKQVKGNDGLSKQYRNSRLNHLRFEKIAVDALLFLSSEKNKTEQLLEILRDREE